MDYPIFIGGEERGSLSIRQQGLYTLFEGALPGLHDGFYRIWLHGGGRSAYLGLMQPWSGGMYLMKKLSRDAMRGFPQIVEKVSDEEREKPEEADEKAASAALSCPWPPPEPAGDELLWLRRVDGSLVSHDGLSGLIALPADLRASAPGTVQKNIEGRNYIIFRY